MKQELRKWVVILGIMIAGLVVGLGLACAQRKASAQPSDLSKAQLLNAYRRAVGSYQASQMAQQQAQKDVDSYNTLAKEVISRDKLSEKAVFSVNLEKDDVTMQIPSPEVKKPETPKPDPAKK